MCAHKETKHTKKLIRRWDSERELSSRRHHTRTRKYNRLVHMLNSATNGRDKPRRSYDVISII